MLEIEGDIWDCKTPLSPICITTNGYIKKNGQCVMGRGIALQAKIRYPKLPKELGDRIKQFGNKVFYFPDYDIITFPTKHIWTDTADIELIKSSAEQLVEMVNSDYINMAESYGWKRIYLVRPGCSNGKLQWKDVKSIIEKILVSDNFIVVQNWT